MDSLHLGQSFSRWRHDLGPCWVSKVSWGLSTHICWQKFPSGIALLSRMCSLLIFPQEFDHITSQETVSTSQEKIALIAALYNRRITGPSSLKGHITYLLEGSAQACASPSVKILYQSFKLSIERYLKGLGHPDHPNILHLVHPDDLDRHRQSAAIRSVLLMLSMHGSELLPVKRQRRLQVCFLFLFVFIFLYFF